MSQTGMSIINPTPDIGICINPKEYKDIVLLAASPSQNLFKITGIVKINHIYGIVTEIIPADVITARLGLFPVGGPAIDITLAAGVDMSNAVVNSMFIKTDIATTPLTKSDATNAFIQETTNLVFAEFIIGQKTGDVNTYIQLVRAGAGNGGKMRWYVEWEPGSDNSLLEAA